MFINLHQGILEEFAAAQALGNRREEIAAFEATRIARERASTNDRKRRLRADVRFVRRKSTWAPVRPGVTVEKCSVCGKDVEYREGYARPIWHLCVVVQARMPRPPEELVGALQDSVHRDSSKLRAAIPLKKRC